ncbi:A disintegrin and metalloproteinase with thrombospondin motifs 20-like [Haliotis rubra]|uniref:A disintegrin and metalloproteinase with thrombospondin motifs 20-like n=1 Tax=Haliotis rubra TaxID=36100 RepID=UPI001EE5EEE0|nr:A disintegrin and metalloproteinase with thrombospondin motifs 20-like [Haliotis rubra]
MAVVRIDKTFAVFTNHEVYYAQAEDCYVRHYSILRSCGTKGEFTVNLTSTGWLVDPDVEWIAGGWKAIIESVIREDGGAVIHLKCGGFHGYCYPKTRMSLVPSFEAVPDSSATEIRCSE